MSLYYITRREIVIQHKDLLLGSHMVWIDQSKDLVLAKCRFGSEGAELHFRNLPGVEPLPHPILEHHTPIKDHHADHLAKHGVVRGHSIHEVIKRVSHPQNCHGNILMRFHIG